MFVYVLVSGPRPAVAEVPERAAVFEPPETPTPATRPKRRMRTLLPFIPAAAPSSAPQAVPPPAEPPGANFLSPASGSLLPGVSLILCISECLYVGRSEHLSSNTAP